jgi:hypothetical protein
MARRQGKTRTNLGEGFGEGARTDKRARRFGNLAFSQTMGP